MRAFIFLIAVTFSFQCLALSIGNWRISTRKDLITGSTIATLSIEASEGDNRWGQKHRLVVTCKNKMTKAYIDFKQDLWVYNNLVVRFVGWGVHINQGAGAYKRMGESKIGIVNPEKFMIKVMSEDQLVVSRSNSVLGKKSTSIFVTENGAEAKKEFSKYCLWAIVD